MSLIKKDRTCNESILIKNNILYGFNQLLKTLEYNAKTKLYSIDISNIKQYIKNNIHLGFILRNNFFNQLHKRIKVNHVFNYLYVIEYPGDLSKGFKQIEHIKPHCHILIVTSTNKETIDSQIDRVFNGSNILNREITNRDDKTKYAGYLTKQLKILDNNSYGFKILTK